MAGVIGVILLPFLGTALGAGCVYFLKKPSGAFSRQGLSGLAAGVMVAASIWSLLLPALEGAVHLGKLACLPVLAGLWCGVWLLRILDRLIPWLHRGHAEPSTPGSRRRGMLTLAVTLHNLPEGMAVGVAAAGFLAGSIHFSAFLTLALGIALQNLPEGAIISLPLQEAGGSKHKACAVGVLSGVVEPIGSGMTLLLATLVVPILPFMLSLAAGAMLYVVVQELIPDMQEDGHFAAGAIYFTAGFSIMMLLDVLLG